MSEEYEPSLNQIPPHAAPSPPSPAEARAVKLRGLLDEWDADAAARHEAKETGKPLGPMTPFPGLDKAIGGALLPGLHILHAASNAGKTALTLQIAATCQCPSLYVTAEMSALELLRRITARVTETNVGKFKTGEIEPKTSAALVRRAVAAAPNLVLLDATRAPASPALIQHHADLTRQEAPHILIVVDSLHSWAARALPGLNEYDALNDGLAALQTIAANLNCPILVIAERNRSSMKEGGQSAGAGSRKIEYSAETVIELHRAPEAIEDSNGETLLQYSLSKNRNGETKKPRNILFHGGFQRFREETK